MIVVLAEVESSAEAVETLRAALVEMEEATLQEEGCHDYAFCQQISDPDKIRIVERWESMEALTAHFATPHMAAFNAALAAAPPRSMQLKIHELGAELSLPS